MGGVDLLGDAWKAAAAAAAAAVARAATELAPKAAVSADCDDPGEVGVIDFLLPLELRVDSLPAPCAEWADDGDEDADDDCD